MTPGTCGGAGPPPSLERLDVALAMPSALRLGAGLAAPQSCAASFLQHPSRMTRTPSTMLELGTPAPPFALPDVVTGRTLTLDDVAGGDAFLVVFWCNHCPFVLHIEEAFVAFAREYAAKGLQVVAVCANDAEAYPRDAPDRMRERANAQGYSFPYLHDESQEVAKAYRAACTPDLYLFDGERRLVYRGQFDGSRPSTDVPVTGEDIRAAVDAVLAGETPPEAQQPSLGCNIKWRPGNAPDYFG